MHGDMNVKFLLLLFANCIKYKILYFRFPDI